MLKYSSAAAGGWAGWASLAHPEFGSSVNPITTRGADYAHHITASPPEFEIQAASLSMDVNCKKINLKYVGLPPQGPCPKLNRVIKRDMLNTKQ